MNGNDPSVISKDVSINGRITGDKSLSVEGRLEGQVSLGNELHVLETGEVEAEIEADTITIEGVLDGDVVARQIVRLVSGCRVTGNIQTPRIEIDENADFKGNIDMDVSVESE